MTGVVLAYHRVSSPARDIHGLAVEPDVFREHMSWIRDRCSPAALDELVESGARGAGRRVAVTLDDGYVDNFTVASRILQDLRIPATFFVTTERLEDREYEYWWDWLERVMLGEDVRTHDLNVDGGDRSWHFAMDSAAARREAYGTLHRAIVRAQADQRERLLEIVSAWAGAGTPGDARNRRMHADEVRELGARPGHTVGAHTDHHLFLPAQPAAVQSAEIERSVHTLERLVGQRPDTLAYPYGAVTPEVRNAADRACLRVAVTTREALIDGHVDPLLVPRFEVTPERARQFGSWMESLFNGG